MLECAHEPAPDVSNKITEERVRAFMLLHMLLILCTFAEGQVCVPVLLPALLVPCLMNLRCCDLSVYS